MTADKLEAAKWLAEQHSELDQDVEQVFLLESDDEADPDEPLKLLEIVNGTLETGVEPVSFAPNPGRGVRFPTVIVEISPREFKTLGSIVPFGQKNWRVAQQLFVR